MSWMADFTMENKWFEIFFSEKFCSSSFAIKMKMKRSFCNIFNGCLKVADSFTFTLNSLEFWVFLSKPLMTNTYTAIQRRSQAETLLNNQCPFSLLKPSEKRIATWHNPKWRGLCKQFSHKSFTPQQDSQWRAGGRLSRHFSTNNKAVMSGVGRRDVTGRRARVAASPAATARLQFAVALTMAPLAPLSCHRNTCRCCYCVQVAGFCYWM